MAVVVSQAGSVVAEIIMKLIVHPARMPQ